MEFKPIGFLKNENEIVINKEYQEGLKGLDKFSHCIVLFNFHKMEDFSQKYITGHPKRKKELPKVGVFSMRSPHRPNKIGMTVVEIISINNNVIKIKNIDAINDTPIIDIKPYSPIDLKKDAVFPDWINKIDT